MTCEHDRICAVLFCFDHPAAHWFDRIFKIKTANEFRPEPKRHSRSCHSDDRDSDSIELFQNVRLNLRERIRRNLAAAFSFHRHVRRQYRHFRFHERVQERLHAPIELVITDDPGVVFQMIEKINHQPAVRTQADIGALINVPDVDQD